ncbi:MAG TPA: LemA family protein [Sedimentisphaerales bacterium]|nr:LemA family protein [Sedimentisphaerales bacterium]
MPVIIIVIVVVILIPVLIYNSLISRKNRVLNVFGTIDALLKKRYDLIPNLVATVKGYAQHERSLLEEVTRIRAQALSGQVSDDEAVELDNRLTKALGRLLLVAENYPNLKASENFMHLQRTLTELEEQISAARRAYNAAVTDYNNAVEMFPTNIVASMMNYKRRRFFEISEKERQGIDAGEHFRR